jgi:hypothetical protein
MDFLPKSGSTASRFPPRKGGSGRGKRSQSADNVAERLADRLDNPAAFLSRTDLRELGLERRAVDAVFRSCPVVVLPGYSRPLIRVGDYVALVERSTFDGTRVR